MNKEISKEKFNALLFLVGQRAAEEGKIEEFQQFCNKLKGGKQSENICKTSG